MSEMIYTSKKRACGECTECCQGWLWGEAHGKSFYAGRPCHFVSEYGCSIYNDRPENPCKTFECSWLDDTVNTFPEWMRPDKCRVLLQPLTTKGGIKYIAANECGEKIDSVVLNWLVLYALSGAANISIQVDRGWSHYGSSEFTKEMTG